MKTVMSGKKIRLEGINCRSDIAETEISEVEVRAIENTQNKTQRKENF